MSKLANPDLTSSRTSSVTPSSGEIGRWMHLYGEILIGIKQLGQPREASIIAQPFPKQFLGVIVHKPAEITPGEGTIGDDADGIGTVANLPRFSDAPGGWEWLVEKRLAASAAPDTFLENGLKRERLEHRLTPR